MNVREPDRSASVTACTPNRKSPVLSLPPGAPVRPVLEKDSFGRQGFSNVVGGGEVFPRPRFGPLSNLFLNPLIGVLLLGAHPAWLDAELQLAKHPLSFIELKETQRRAVLPKDCQNLLPVLLGQPSSKNLISLGSKLLKCRQRLRGIQIIVHGLFECLTKLGQSSF